ncbi:low affinity potassium transporter [Cladophialophora chaetospira]|uniref:Potassium transport protein n=1 Tax=Cladophialophora chaetospira TaxID=386627 RepID=A0AA39CE05_9EURO|nr:low affinity potassium transporter [Cladophialophora chaetospira]
MAETAGTVGLIEHLALNFWEFSKRNIIPDLFIKRRFNFITIHYLYMIGMSILGSVILYGIGNIRYIDALFFASGSCTQSGLNTLDVNTIKFGQQFVLYLLAMLCNPIAINSTVVFVRLYWFEKRFEDVVKSSVMLRRTRTNHRTNTFGKEEAAEQGLHGVAGRAIRILRNTGRSTGLPAGGEKPEQTNGKAVDSSDTSGHEPEQPHGILRSNDHDLHTTASPEDLRIPERLSPEQHIRFLENQRNPSDTTALRIPSPREFERGSRPQNIADDLDDTMLRHITSEPELPSSNERRKSEAVTSDDNAPVSHIAFDEEPRFLRDRHDKTATFPRFNTKQSTQPPSTYDIPEPGHLRRRGSGTFNSLRRVNTPRELPAPYLSWQPTIGRNSFFVGLTEEQREELGGIEYRALKALALILVLYFFLFHLLGVICLLPWILRSGTYGPFITGQGQGRVWWSFFTSASAFNDLGFTLTNNSMIYFQKATFPLLLMTFLIIIGNTGFPCMLRFTIWLTSTFCTEGSPLWEELKFLLDHPRRCFTLLFPREATWWLFAILVILNGVDLIFFIILDLNDPTVTVLPPGFRVLDGLFQAAATRTAGFAVVNLADLHPAIQVSYLIMMYISVFPIAISMRRTNVYEEKSLGIYGSGSEEDENEPSYVGAHLRKQLSFDLWYIFLGLFIIAIVEGGQLSNTNQYAFTLFSVLFEIVSAYGTVGLSLGYPTINASFSAEFHTLSKLIIIAMQIRGRHRGLPYELDRAILLPSESLQQKEAKEAERVLSRVQRRRSSIGAHSTMSAVDGILEGRNFRSETGLSSAYRDKDEDPDVHMRPRTNTNRSHQSHHRAGSSSEHQLHSARHSEPHSARRGIGVGMSKLAEGIESIKEEKTRE